MTYALTMRPAARSTWLGLEGNARCRDTRVEANRFGRRRGRISSAKCATRSKRDRRRLERSRDRYRNLVERIAISRRPSAAAKKIERSGQRGENESRIQSSRSVSRLICAGRVSFEGGERTHRRFFARRIGVARYHRGQFYRGTRLGA